MALQSRDRDAIKTNHPNWIHTGHGAVNLREQVTRMAVYNIGISDVTEADKIDDDALWSKVASQLSYGPEGINLTHHGEYTIGLNSILGHAQSYDWFFLRVDNHATVSMTTFELLPDRIESVDFASFDPGDTDRQARGNARLIVKMVFERLKNLKLLRLGGKGLTEEFVETFTDEVNNRDFRDISFTFSVAWEPLQDSLTDDHEVIHFEEYSDYKPRLFDARDVGLRL